MFYIFIYFIYNHCRLNRDFNLTYQDVITCELQESLINHTQFVIPQRFALTGGVFLLGYVFTSLILEVCFTLLILTQTLLLHGCSHIGVAAECSVTQILFFKRHRKQFWPDACDNMIIDLNKIMQKGVARFSNNLKRKKEGHLERKTLGLELLQDGRE